MALGLPGPSRELSLLKTLSLIPQPQRPCEIAYLRDLDGNVSGLVTQPAHRALEAGQDGRETAARLKKEPHPHPPSLGNTVDGAAGEDSGMQGGQRGQRLRKELCLCSK